MAKKAVTLTTKGSYVSKPVRMPGSVDEHFPRLGSSWFFYWKQVVLDNGIVKLSILKPQGFLTGINYGGMDNLLNLKSDESSRG